MALEWVYLGNNSAPTLFPAFLTYSSFAFLLAQILTILTSHIMWVSGIDPIISYFCLNCKQASWLGLGGGPQLSLVTCHLPLATSRYGIHLLKKKKLSFWWFWPHVCLFTLENTKLDLTSIEVYATKYLLDYHHKSLGWDMFGCLSIISVYLSMIVISELVKRLTILWTCGT